jgi:heme/copper-type cytochrome/quinol oxidase subunit 2
VGALSLALVLAAEKTTAEEGRDIILVMLAVGFIFIGVILIGQLSRWRAHKRAERRRLERRAY